MTAAAVAMVVVVVVGSKSGFKQTKSQLNLARHYFIMINTYNIIIVIITIGRNNRECIDNIDDYVIVVIIITIVNLISTFDSARVRGRGIDDIVVDYTQVGGGDVPTSRYVGALAPKLPPPSPQSCKGCVFKVASVCGRVAGNDQGGIFFVRIICVSNNYYILMLNKI